MVGKDHRSSPTATHKEYNQRNTSCFKFVTQSLPYVEEGKSKRRWTVATVHEEAPGERTVATEVTHSRQGPTEPHAYIAHTLIWLAVSFVLPNHKQFIRVNRMLYIAHTFNWLPVSFVLPNHKQFIQVNHMLCIAHAFIWLPVSFLPPNRKQLIELNHMPCIAYAAKI